MATVVVVGLGPAGPEFLTEAGNSAIERIPQRYVRTTRHPAAGAVPKAHSFDDVYRRAPSLEHVYAEIVDALVEAATAAGEVLYAVPGSPLVAERTVELLLADDRVDVELVPGLSFLDLAWAGLAVDPVAAGVRVVDGRRFAVEAAGERGPLLVAQCDSKDVLSDIKLAAGDNHPDEVVVLQRLGLPDATVRTLPWDDLDRDVEPDHLTTLYLPAAAPPIAAEVARFAELVRTLRERCPWDREQTHRTLTRHLLEETYEVLEAIEDLDEPGGVEHLEEELGDLLFQVVFHATLAAEEGSFTLADVADGIHDKLVRRHPHVFGTVEAETATQVVHNWEQIKRQEKGRTSIMDGIPGDLPSLLYAHKVQRKAASAGVEVEPGGDGTEVTAPAAATDEEIGALLFGLVDLARRAGVDPEAALRATTARFRDDFMEKEKEASDG
ncbi:MAG: nucleoside triphosphate pyrophosphohydrolase [Acidimicrobiia bacterium]|nr:nucleoside triphosphate pyrophosphohydrolase [Acidimicrobiia bacterium]